MTKKGLQTPKGFRDFLPPAASRRALLLGKIKPVLERYGFAPLETPALEFAETLKGKYGEEEKLIFEFSDRGDRRVALRYDQTVPLARVVASNADLPKPFKRYQIQPVWRADNPQRGRFREFLQVDFDIIGTNSILADVEIAATAISATKAVGFNKFVLKVNDRKNFNGLQDEVIRTVDKLEKIGETGVTTQLNKFGYDKAQAKALLKRLRESPITKSLKNFLDLLDVYGIDKDKYAYDPTIARGLDYYTGIIYELDIEGYSGGSVGGGGRYDNLIGKFSGRQIPAVGFSFGFDRLLEASEGIETTTKDIPATKVLVTVFNNKMLNNSIELVSNLRSQGISAEIAIDPEEKLDKQLKYADNKAIPFVAILGPDEIKTEKISVKELSTGRQTKATFSELKRILK